jgi:hypothetical protein
MTADAVVASAGLIPAGAASVLDCSPAQSIEGTQKSRERFSFSVYLASIVYMNDIVHARLDEHTRKIMRRLQRRHGWSDSDIVRNGIRAPGDAELKPGQRTRRIVGLGKFATGIKDLGSNKKHLRDFGQGVAAPVLEHPRAVYRRLLHQRDRDESQRVIDSNYRGN